MHYIKKLKNKTLLLIIAIIGITIGIIGFSYSIFINTNSSNDQEIKTGNLKVVFKEGQTITTNMLPMSNETGLEQDGYTFEVSNEGTIVAKYTIKIKRGISNTIDLNQLYIALDENNPILISELNFDPANNSIYIVKENIPIHLAETSKHNLKIWIREDALENIGNKIVSLILEIESVVKD